MGRIKFAMVCAANQNRSMEAHALLKEHGFEVGSRPCVSGRTRTFFTANCVGTESRIPAMQVGSFGVNGHVKLPGPTQHQPNVYNFGTPYEVIYKDLRSKDEAFYEQKGLLQVGSSFSRSYTGNMVKDTD